MAYLYADPIVKKSKDGRLVGVNTPLDLDIEYEKIVDNLKQTGKQFNILKEAVNAESFQQIICKNPKIIHISSHGAFDKDMKEFYLAIEGTSENIALEDKFYQTRLGQLLGIYKSSMEHNKNQSSHQIKVAFVSACHSEVIGELLLNAGIPIVIAVNSDQEIMDDVCKLFSKHFYTNLLEGFTIKNSFDQARKTVQVNQKDYNTCCCAHKHTDECVWYKFFQENELEAHMLHSQKCSCRQGGLNGRREHLKSCKAFINFKEFLRKKKTEYEPKKQLVNLDDSDDLMIDDEFEDMMDNVIIPLDAAVDDLIMCCCKPETPHDESMKFNLKVNKQCEQSILDSPIFEQRGYGTLVQLSENQRKTIPCNVDRKIMKGKHLLINDLIQFFTKKGSQYQRVLAVNGVRGTGACSLTKFAVKYVMDRHFIEHGAFLIDAENKFTSHSLFSAISKKLQLFTTDQQEILEMIKTLNILIVIDNCQQYYEKNPKDLEKTIRQIIEQTEQLKVVLITHQKNKLSMDFSQKYFGQIQVNHLEKIDAVQIMYEQCCNCVEFRQKYPEINDLSKHDLFKEFTFTPLQIMRLCLLIQNGQQLDQIYKMQIEQKKQSEDSTIADSDINKMIYQDMKEKYQEEVNIIHMLCVAKQGLSIFDLQRIQLISQGKISFGDINVFLNTQCKIVESIYIPELEEQRYSLNGSFQKYIEVNVLQIDPKLKNMILNIFVKYMSVLSRQILKSIKRLKNLDFNPYIVSSQIDHGILWSEPDKMVYILNFEQDCENYQYSKDIYMELAIYIFQQNEINYHQILDINEDLLNINGGQMIEQSSELASYLDEIYVNIPSIFIMLNRYQEAMDAINRVEMVFMNNNMEITQAKMKLIQASLELELNQNLAFDKEKVKKLLWEADLYFDKTECSEGNGETFFVYGIYHMKQLEKNIEKLQMQQSHNTQKWQTFDSESNGKNSFIGHQRSGENSLSIWQPAGNIDEKINSEFQEVLKMIEKARENFKSKIAISKLWLIYSELILDKIKCISGTFENLQAYTTNEELKNLDSNLNYALDCFNDNDCKLLEARCLLQQAKIENHLKQYVNSRQKIIDSLSITQAGQLNAQKIINESTQLFEQVCSKIQIEFNNVFIFAQSRPVNCLHKKNFVIQKQIQEDCDKLKNKLASTNKQLDLKFEVLNKHFLQYINQTGCKVLHLTPYCDCVDMDQNQPYLMIENENFESIKLSPKDLKKLFQQGTGIHLVIIDMTNCKEICQVFIDLGVPHVISFNAEFKKEKNPEKDQDKYENLLGKYKRQNQIINFQKEFSINFYPLIVENLTIVQAISMAEEITKKSLSLDPSLKIKVEHFMQVGKHKDKLFDNDRLDKRKKLNNGPLCDISQIRANTNIILKPLLNPFILRKETIFSSIVNLLTGKTPNVQNSINIYGKCGSGKTRLILEVALYLQYRYMFSGGIYTIDLSTVKNFEQVNDIINHFKQKKIEKKPKNKKKFQRASSWSSNTDINSNQSDKVLLIFDNTDEFVNQNRFQLELNLKFLREKIKNLTLIFISQKELDSKYNFYPMTIQPFIIQESLLYVQSLNAELCLLIRSKENSKINELFDIFRKNPQLLDIMTWVYQYGGVSLLERLEILPRSQLESHDEDYQIDEKDNQSTQSNIFSKRRSLRRNQASNLDLSLRQKRRTSCNYQVHKEFLCSFLGHKSNDGDQFVGTIKSNKPNPEAEIKAKKRGLDLAIIMENIETKDQQDLDLMESESQSDELQSQIMVDELDRTDSFNYYKKSKTNFDESGKNLLRIDQQYDPLDSFNCTISKVQNFNPYENKNLTQTISKGSKGNMFGDLNFKSNNQLNKSIIFVHECIKLSTTFKGFYISATDTKDQYLKVLIVNEENYEETQKLEIYGPSANRIQRSKTAQTGDKHEDCPKVRYETVFDIGEIKKIELFVPDEIWQNNVARSDIKSVGQFSAKSQDFSPFANPCSNNYGNFSQTLNLVQKKQTRIMKNLGLGGVEENSEEASEEYDIHNPASSLGGKLSSYSDVSANDINTEIQLVQSKNLKIEIMKSSSLVPPELKKTMKGITIEEMCNHGPREKPVEKISNQVSENDRFDHVLSDPYPRDDFDDDFE